MEGDGQQFSENMQLKLSQVEPKFYIVQETCFELTNMKGISWRSNVSQGSVSEGSVSSDPKALNRYSILEKSGVVKTAPLDLMHLPSDFTGTPAPLETLVCFFSSLTSECVYVTLDCKESLCF